MKKQLFLALGLVGLTGGLASLADAQASWAVCNAPTSPYSTPFIVAGPITNPLIGFAVGITGSVTYGGGPGPCFATAVSRDVPGRFGLVTGPSGSRQLADDNNMPLTFGMPEAPAGCWSQLAVVIDGTVTPITSAGGFFAGNGGRYTYYEFTQDSIRVKIQLDARGDAVRAQYDLSNSDTNPHTVSMWYTAVPSFITGSGERVNGGEGSGGRCFISIPGRPEPQTEQRIVRTLDPGRFPTHVDFTLDQARPAGLRVELGKTPNNVDSSGVNSDATDIEEIVIGGFSTVNGWFPPGDSPFADGIIADRPFGQASFITKMPNRTLATNGSTRFVQYLRLPWARTSLPGGYAATVDAPLVINSNGGALNPNPFRIRVWVDNVALGNPSVPQTGVPMNNTAVTISFPKINDNTTPSGLALSADVPQKTINNIAWKSMGFTEFNVSSDGSQGGDLPYRIVVDSPTYGKKTIDGTIKVSVTPRLTLQKSPKANLVAVPWVFADSAWFKVLNLPNSVFQAFDWDSTQAGYVNSTSPERGKGHWIVYTGASNPLVQTLASSPTQPNDLFTGAPQIQLRPGWNLIGNPYNYSFPLRQVQGVSQGGSGTSQDWLGLVAEGAVANFLAYWDSVNSRYVYVSAEASVQPNLGYWIFVTSAQNVTLQFPPVNSLGVASVQPGNDVNWKLQIVGRTQTEIDDQNFIANVSTPNATTRNQIMEPPAAPVTSLQVYFTGQTLRGILPLAQTIGIGNGTQEFPLVARTLKASTVTLTWPGMDSVPSNYRVMLVDNATGRQYNMRQQQNFIFAAGANSTHYFTVRLISNVEAARGN